MRLGGADTPYVTDVFRPVTLAGGPQRYVLIARGNYVGVYDGHDHRWAFTWVPLVEMNSAAIWRPSETQVVLSALTDDGVLWRFRWYGDLEATPDCSLQQVAPLDGKVNGHPRPVCGWTSEFSRCVRSPIRPAQGTQRPSELAGEMREDRHGSTRFPADDRRRYRHNAAASEPAGR